jgi:cytochrome oxidase Cu insertion factor (SCO1/SenC/PrrC family)
MSLSEPFQNPAPAPTRSPLTFWLLITALLLALIGGSYFLKTSLNQFELNRKSALPIFRQLRDPFVALDRSGTEKNLADLEGKAVILAYTYTRCPHGCAGVAAQMLKIRDAFAGQSNVHLVSIAVWPEIDTAPMLKAFSESIGVRPEDPWWWLSTDRSQTWNYLTDQIGFEASREIPPADRINPQDVVAHDLRAVLIDPQRRVRAFYSLMHPQTEVAQIALEKLRRDIASVLKN